MPAHDHQLPDEDMPSAGPEDAVDLSKPGADRVAEMLGETTARHDRAAHRTIAIAVGAGVLVIALAVGGFLVARSLGGSSSNAKPGAATSTDAEKSGQGGTGTGAGSAGQAVTAPVAQGQVTQTASATPPGAKSGAPKAPAENGAALATLSAPPEHSVAMVVVPKGFKSGDYAVVFRPYGWGATGQAGGRLVVRIDSAKPLDAAAKSIDRDWKDRNAMVFVGPDVARVVAKGGTYKGTLRIRPQGDVGMLYLVKVTPGN